MPLFADRNPSAYVICIRYMYGFLQAERSIRRATRQASAPPPVIDGLSHEDRMRTGRHSASATRGDSGGRELAQVPMMSVTPPFLETVHAALAKVSPLATPDSSHSFFAPGGVVYNSGSGGQVTINNHWHGVSNDGSKTTNNYNVHNGSGVWGSYIGPPE